MSGNSFPMITAVVFDTKPYDQEALEQASVDRHIEWRFLEFRLTQDTAPARPAIIEAWTRSIPSS